MSRFGSPPKSDLDVRPTQDDIDFFEENGYLVVPQITTQEELDWLTDVFLGVMNEGEGTGVFMPIGFELFAIAREKFRPVDMIAVARKNEKLDRGNWRKAAVEGNFFLRGFNHLMIFKKV